MEFTGIRIKTDENNIARTHIAPLSDGRFWVVDRLANRTFMADDIMFVIRRGERPEVIVVGAQEFEDE